MTHEASENERWARLFAAEPRVCSMAVTFPTKMLAIADELAAKDAELVELRKQMDEVCDWEPAMRKFGMAGLMAVVKRYRALRSKS